MTHSPESGLDWRALFEAAPDRYLVLAPELLVAPTAERGVELALARRPSLVIMDINLPGMSGIDAVPTRSSSAGWGLRAIEMLPVVAVRAPRLPAPAQ